MTSRKPTAFDLSDAKVAVVRPGAPVPASAAVVVEETATDFDGEPAPLPVLRRRFGWGRLFWTGLGGLVSLSLGLYIDDLVRSLFARDDWLGWLALGCVGLAGVGALAVILREIAGLLWLRRIDKLRARADAVCRSDDRRAADQIATEIATLYERRSDLAEARRANQSREGEIMGGRDRLILVEADWLTPLDAVAMRLVSDAVKRVSVVTAVSPRAAVDVIFVVVAVLSLIRRLADLYGGRPGFFGLLRLTRLTIAHLAVTGTIAVGDSLIQQMIGHGLAAKLSARLGEGVINGLLTARLGLAAMDVCRPLDFIESPRPGVASVMPSMGGKSETD